jgi:diguanylate cyclase (GGDEF)-like protein/PAS domain S-box-containing protein
MHSLRRLIWPLLLLSLLAIISALDAGGALVRYERVADELRARLLSHEVRSDIVIVGIDAYSLEALDAWPWPRRHHAELLNRLLAAGAQRVFIDIDFSSSSNPLDDAALQAALARWPRDAVILPAFVRPATATDASLSFSKPMHLLEPHATLASVMLTPGPDGLVSAVRTSWNMAGRTIPSVAAATSGVQLTANSELSIDFSIAPSSLDVVSYSDVLAGQIDPHTLAGKTVFVGATSIELGDMVPVPVYQSLPGVVVQALATQTVLAGPLRMPSRSVTLAVLAGWTALCAIVLGGGTWRRSLVAVVLAAAVSFAASVYLYSALRIELQVMPFWCIAALVFVAGTLRSLDQQTLRAIGYALGLRRREALLESIVTSSIDCIVSIDATGRVRECNAAAASIFGCEPDTLVGLPLARFIPALEEAVLESLQDQISEWDLVRADGMSLAIELSLSRVHIDDERLYVAIIRDVSDRKAQQRALRHQATHDPLTALPNRTALAEHFQTMLSHPKPAGAVTLLLLDLCRFKEVNDTLGHSVGDEVLKEVCRRFRAAIGSDAFIARLGGDEFTIIVDRIENREAVERLCGQLQNSVRAPVTLAGVALEVGVSIGITSNTNSLPDLDTMLRQADVAMYVSKRSGTAYQWYEASLDENSVRRLTMLSDLRADLGSAAVELHYQPKVNLRTGAAESVEALVRWRHGTYGAVSPADFIAAAETTDLIVPLTNWTLREALRQLSRWRRAGLQTTVAVNLSARMLQDAAFPSRLRQLLEASDVLPGNLELEITESATMTDPARALRVIREIDALGVAMAIDDFGTGYSSLAYLRELPVKTLKIDKAFVMSMQSQSNDRVIVESTIQLAHALNLLVVAEGVESEWDARFLAGMNCDFGQGYWFSRALPAADCLAWIQQRNAEHSEGHHSHRAESAFRFSTRDALPVNSSCDNSGTQPSGSTI